MDDKEEDDTGREQGGRGGKGKRACGDREEPLPVPERFKGEILDTPDKLAQYLDGPVKRYEPAFVDREQFELFAMLPLNESQRTMLFQRLRQDAADQRAMPTAALVHVCGDFKSNE